MKQLTNNEKEGYGYCVAEMVIDLLGFVRSFAGWYKVLVGRVPTSHFLDLGTIYMILMWFLFIDTHQLGKCDLTLELMGATCPINFLLVQFKQGKQNRKIFGSNYIYSLIYWKCVLYILNQRGNRKIHRPILENWPTCPINSLNTFSPISSSKPENNRKLNK